MEVYIYPGSFCPPTFGHLSIVYDVSKFVRELIIVCSLNPEKDNNWFTPEQSKEMWLSYLLPKNVKVLTLEDFKTMKVDSSNLVMVRGIRDYKDLEYEKNVTLYNKEHFGITKYLYLFSDDKYKDISSTKTRMLAENLEIEELSNYVSFKVISRLLEKVLSLDNLFLVVGRPGSGKSTFLNILKDINKEVEFINTDDFNDALRPLLKKRFQEADLISVAINDEASLRSVIAKPWMNLLRKSLNGLNHHCKNLFVEIPYGLQKDKSMFRFLGAKILYIGCNEKTNFSRNIHRNTPRLIEFIEKIPGLDETMQICKQNRLDLEIINTDCDLDTMVQIAREFLNHILEQ